MSDAEAKAIKPPYPNSISGYTSETSPYVSYKRLGSDEDLTNMPSYVQDYTKFAERVEIPPDQRVGNDNDPFRTKEILSEREYKKLYQEIQAFNQKQKDATGQRREEAIATAKAGYLAAIDNGASEETAKVRGIEAAAAKGYTPEDLTQQWGVDIESQNKRVSDVFGRLDEEENRRQAIDAGLAVGPLTRKEASAAGFRKRKKAMDSNDIYKEARKKAIPLVEAGYNDPLIPFAYGPPPESGENEVSRKSRQKNNRLIRAATDAEREKIKQREIKKAKAVVTDPNSLTSGSGGGGEIDFAALDTLVGLDPTGGGTGGQGGAANPAAANPAAAAAVAAADPVVDGPLAGMTAEDVAVDKSQFTRGQQRKNKKAGVDYAFLSAKNAAMLKLYQQGWVTKNEEQKKDALYAADSGYRQAAGTKSENWYLGVANQQIMAFGKNLERQQAQGFATGGMNGGMDTIPAMLTPGEFVMSREAVAKHGVGYMKNLNMGKATGFRRGGVVGTGNVQYKANGGSVDGGGGMMIDPSLLSEALNGFSAAFSEQMTTITGAMSGIADKLQGIAESFGSLSMSHTFAGELSMNVNISNKDAIIAAVSDGLLPMIANQIQAQIDASANSFNAGG